MHPPRPHFSAENKKAAHCGRLGSLGTKLNLKKDGAWDRAEQRLRMCRDGRGLESNLVSFSKGFSKHPHILAIIKVDSEYLRFLFKLKVDYFILY